MGKLKNLQIVLDKNVFGQGDVIKGHINMEVDSDGSKNMKSHGQRTDRKLEIQPGTNRIPFEFQLPNIQPLPFSFESKVGYVRYWAKATVSVKQLLLTKDYKTLKHFSMIGPTADLNTMADVQTEVDKTTTTRQFLNVGRVQNVTTVGLPRRGYVPGESITVTGHVDNRVGKNQRQFKAKLVQKTIFKFKVTDNNRSEDVTLSTASAKVACQREDRTDFTVGPLLIPPVPASGLVGCGLIDIEYFVQIKEADLDKVRFLVYIGTVPLRTSAPVLSLPAAPVPSLPVATDFTAELAARLEKRSSQKCTSSAASYDALQEASPPSYEEAVGVPDQPTGGQDREDYFRSEDHFVPRYPYFNLSGK
ncbi:arrestin domain-containing protein 3-like [Patiria miniata]|uniref:Arrestin C-terminal-like domain-containing protein n=1 Tax=Patiria miniata TaxID=46514 RepID=A0A914BPF0_PATMI|nr:arrestin domain-containing protein 3-like [Patiria miniata]